MLRFIVERHEVDNNVNSNTRDYVTLDVDIPELEVILRRGGSGEMGFESWRLIGAEILTANVELTGAARHERE